MNYMTCTTCRRLVQVNATGICLSCQRGFVGIDQEDIYDKCGDSFVSKLKKREKEIENALKER